MMRKPSLSIACALILCVNLAVQGFAQVNTASLTGLVTDPTGAAVAGAAVTAKNRATNVDTSATTDASGYYTFASLPVGIYTLTIEVQGFKKTVQDNVALEVGQKARIDFSLAVGAIGETSTVTAAAPILTTQEETGHRSAVERSQLGRLDRVGTGCAGGSVHRRGRRHRERAHRRRQRSRHTFAAK
jgi:hypothetical protein